LVIVDMVGWKDGRTNGGTINIESGIVFCERANEPRGAAAAAEILNGRQSFPAYVLMLRATEYPDKWPEHQLLKEIKRQGGDWWARQDSNLEPDGYEPSALTIELRAPRRRMATAIRKPML
jgi:hypothetical protein